MIYYIRDEEGSLIGLKYNDTMYYYIKNMQEDIIGITDSNNNLLCSYVYDSWGNIISIKDNDGNIINDTSHIGIINPYRYRSYYYDSETKLYYLNSRYYNPEWGRFINADELIKSENNKYNLYTYCNNNPIKFADYNGKSATTAAVVKSFSIHPLLGLATVAAVIVVPAVLGEVTDYAITHKSYKSGNNNDDKKNKDYYVYALRDCSKPGVQGEACKVEYVGRTGNLDSAIARHNKNIYRSHLELKILEGPMDYDHSRVREQYYIKYYDTLNKYNKMNNQINGLSPSKYDKYKSIINSLSEEDLTYVGGSIW